MIFKRNKSIFGIMGNKENDIKNFIDYLPSERIKIVEPFGGTYAVCRCVYYDDKYKKYVNDNDTNTYFIYNNLEEYQNNINKNNNIAKNFLYKNKYVDYKKYKEYEKDNINTDDLYYKLYLKSHWVRGGMIKVLKKDRNYSETIKISKNINFSNDDYSEIFEKFKYDEETFIFLDPPYMFSDNWWYEKTYMKKNGHDEKDFINNKYDNTKILIDVYEMFKDEKTKAKIMLVINKLYFIEYLFSGFVKASYIKCYQLSNKKETLLIITNY